MGTAPVTCPIRVSRPGVWWAIMLRLTALQPAHPDGQVGLDLLEQDLGAVVEQCAGLGRRGLVDHRGQWAAVSLEPGDVGVDIFGGGRFAGQYPVAVGDEAEADGVAGGLVSQPAGEQHVLVVAHVFSVSDS